MLKKTIGTIALSAALALVAPMAFAQTSTPTTTAPGVPNTGAGGDQAVTLAVMAVSGLAAMGGMLYLMRNPRKA